ncbi:MAG: hypothetical protein AVDCRST_MAG34-1666 [uncultured Nocardioidaceae bacterium]|uniref:Helix-turn-helix domain-containing protein n=1 Tax=uncultured Nocardioidaceae bacterium TaxID=253824 RepID=A0A6J4M458_9ACTN|nr:MAG: hypothetical protein AVDCRST_MAG34-1666 [uncultured Nocardioidaceae bacterium]
MVVDRSDSGVGAADNWREVAALESQGFLTPGEVAAVLHVDPNTVARWSNEGKLASIRTPGGHRRYPASEVLRLASGGSADVTRDRAGEARSRPPVPRPRTPEN